MSYKIVLVKSALKDYSNLNEPFKTQKTKHINDIEKNGMKAQNIKSLTGN